MNIIELKDEISSCSDRLSLCALLISDREHFNICCYSEKRYLSEIFDMIEEQLLSISDRLETIYNSLNPKNEL